MKESLPSHCPCCKESLLRSDCQIYKNIIIFEDQEEVFMYCDKCVPDMIYDKHHVPKGN